MDGFESKSEKIEDNTKTRSWVDLPQDIIALVHNKLHFTDQVRFRAVCKSWRVPSDAIKCSDHLPWLTFYSSTRSELPDSICFTCYLRDPFSPNRVHKVSNSIENLKSTSNQDDNCLALYASKNGWVLLGCKSQCYLFFLHNPFTNEVIFLPRLWCFPYVAATFTTNPKSPECEFLVLYQLTRYEGYYSDTRICIYCPSKGKSWIIKHLEFTSEMYKSISYKNGDLHCLSKSGTLKSFRLADESKVQLTSVTLSPIGNFYVKCFLIEKDENLVVLWKHILDTSERWEIKLDLYGGDSDAKTSLKNYAFITIGKVIMVVPKTGLNIRELYNWCVKTISFYGNIAGYVEPPYVRN